MAEYLVNQSCLGIWMETKPHHTSIITIQIAFYCSNLKKIKSEALVV